ncbi:DUF4267 domain-containing protein [Glycomyces albidus]|uniref:DUF4267 domain-containing protein n=1 Tax=Glycomyces albidus TaxID=2656774 RepID=A0A6L5GD69_9ACTN|nr:DUF4267 domain-containing protein [Glycomyces albidus]MQM27600.1 DUF4267 domain-containing protein [Glycomyces albidus]
MARRITADALTVLSVLFVFSFGLQYLLTPAAVAPSMGFAHWPTGEAAEFLSVKGARDLGSAVVLLVLLLIRERRALGWALIATALIPIGDGSLILAHGGSAAMAFGVHYTTAVGVIAIGLLQLSVAKRAKAVEA